VHVARAGRGVYGPFVTSGSRLQQSSRRGLERGRGGHVPRMAGAGRSGY